MLDVRLLGDALIPELQIKVVQSFSFGAFGETVNQMMLHLHKLKLRKWGDRFSDFVGIPCIPPIDGSSSQKYPQSLFYDKAVTSKSFRPQYAA